MSRAVNRLDVGILLVPYTGAMAGETPRWQHLRDMAQRAEDVGFDSVWLPDHLLLRSGNLSGGAWECCSLLAGLAVATERVKLGTAVISTAFRNPAMLAKIVSTVNEMSGGRLIVGLGAGWNEPEFHAFGYPTDNRYSRFAEALEIFHGLITTGRVDFEGRFYSAPDCELAPYDPAQRPGIMIGSTGRRMIELAARYADTWNVWLPRGGMDPIGRSHPDEIPPLQARVDAACSAVGRDPATLDRTAAVAVDMAGDGRGLVSHWGEVITGSSQHVAETLLRFGQEGISSVIVAVDPMSLAGIEALAPAVAAVKAANTAD
jgi:alkanesulfonate monooxygenase SsuD/methylene tetrahydromethanopterin reductase-like flavin-dependent oxidoreductase (luciferase family)